MPRFVFVSAVVAMGFLVGSAQAAYVLSPLSGGLNEKTVQQGGSFTLDLVLSSNASDFNTSAIFTVRFDKAGLTYNGHTWGSPYDTNSGDNKSKPTNVETTGGLSLAKSSYVAGVADLDAVDAYFENFLSTGQFNSGTLLSLNLTVPSGFAVGDVVITSVPDTFDNGALVATTGQTFTLHVTPVPEPGTIGLVLGAMFPLLARRRTRSC